MKTVDDFGTPGYVSPEQAYGRPTYQSDCFAVGLILYEFITDVLPRWPFRWPLRGQKRFRRIVKPEQMAILREEFGDRDLAVLGRHLVGRAPPSPLSRTLRRLRRLGLLRRRLLGSGGRLLP